ncbi:vacuolar protein sorting-associated protein 4-like [Atheta coriaria]|uniref:vacuolar protein sorting-associated protein 4-like n=1 Tax=Dalotia coriaria TaxID=877792 RepID=UPI0031F346DB
MESACENELQWHSLEKFYKTLELLNESLENHTIERADVSNQLMEAIDIKQSLSLMNISMTLHQKTQLDAIANTLITLMKETLKRNLCITNVTESPIVPQEPLKDALEDFLCTPRAQGFQSVCGMQEDLELFSAMFILPIYQPQLFQHESTHRSLLLHGPPGCGKTQLVHALATELNAKLYCLTPANVMSQFVGATEKVVRKVFEHLRSRTDPVVLFIDEVDAFCRTRNDNEMDHCRRLKIEFMEQLDLCTTTNSKLIVVAATNVPWDIDSAIVRRFEKQLHLGLPQKEQRNALLQFYLTESYGQSFPPTIIPSFVNSEQWPLLLDLTEGYSNSDLKQIVRCAKQKPILELVRVTTWNLENNMYIPCYLDAKPGNISCSVYDLPPSSVISRPVNIQDLLIAAQSIPRTVSDHEISKFQAFALNAR